MSLINVKKPVREILTQSSSFPFSLNPSAGGLSIINNATSTMTLTVTTANKTFEIPIPAACTYDGDFDGIQSLTHSAGTDFFIEVR